MTQLDRRRFLYASAATLALKPLNTIAQTAATAPATLTLHPDKAGSTVPASFIGLSYETQQLSDPSFFSPANHGLIAQLRALSPRGVLRLGGNTSDVGWWKPRPDSPKPPMNVRKVVGEPNADLSYAIEPLGITNLRGFLDATGWTCLFGINLGTNTPALGADEAVFAAKTLGWTSHGGKLEYFQLGNEPDLFRNHMRDPQTWNADAYLDEWLAMANAIRARVPEARFGLPDTSGNPEWSARIAERLAPMAEKPRVAAISHHYYFGGPPSNPQVNIGRLLKPDPRVMKTAATTREAADKLHVPYRMTEGNTCYRGGKPGVSDVFAASLWAADYLLLLASLGYAGVNLHGGDGQMVANSLGGTLPGEELMPDRTVPHARPFYTPVAHIGDKYVLEPVAYGMLFAGKFAGAKFMALDFNPGTVNATAYAATLPTGQEIVAIINKDETQPLTVRVPGFSLGEKLTAPSLTSKDVQITTPRGNIEVSTVAPASAVLLYSTGDTHIR